MFDLDYDEECALRALLVALVWCDNVPDEAVLALGDLNGVYLRLHERQKFRADIAAQKREGGYDDS